MDTICIIQNRHVLLRFRSSLFHHDHHSSEQHLFSLHFCACGLNEERINLNKILSELHWLPVRHRINFKIAAITHTVLQSQQPSYLAALTPRYAPVRSLRSSSSLSICVPLRKTSMAASRSFSSVAPKIWNALPGHPSQPLPAFRRALKHHFFLCAYPDSRTSGGITPF